MTGNRGASHVAIIGGLALLAVAAGGVAYVIQPPPKTEFVYMSVSAQMAYKGAMAIKVNGKPIYDEPYGLDARGSLTSTRDVSDLTAPGENKIAIEISSPGPVPLEPASMRLRVSVQHLKKGQMVDTMGGGEGGALNLEKEIPQPEPETPAVIEATFTLPPKPAASK